MNISGGPGGRPPERKALNLRARVIVLAASVLLLGSAAVGYAAYAVRSNSSGKTASSSVDLARSGQIVFRSTAKGSNGRLAAVSARAPGGRRTVSKLTCVRVYVAGGSGVCLTPSPGVTEGFTSVLLGRDLRATRRITPPGIPNRARLSPSGRFGAWTAFVTGHSYVSSGFSTRTSIYDTRTRRLYRDIETLQVFRGSSRYRAIDMNFWGVTIAPDDDTFYASMSSRGRTYLIRGSISRWRATTVRENAECPSLSPSGRRLVFKQRIPSTEAPAERPWRLAILDLKTSRVTPLRGTEGVDDQAAWLDDSTVMYGMARDGGSDVWAASASGREKPRLLIEDAASPTRT